MINNIEFVFQDNGNLSVREHIFLILKIFENLKNGFVKVFFPDYYKYFLIRQVSSSELIN